MVRSGDPDAIDSIVPMAFGNLALDLILELRPRQVGRLEERALRQPAFGRRHLNEKIVDVERFYDTKRYRPKYENFEMKPLFIMTSEM